MLGCVTPSILWCTVRRKGGNSWYCNSTRRALWGHGDDVFTDCLWYGVVADVCDGVRGAVRADAGQRDGVSAVAAAQALSVV